MRRLAVIAIWLWILSGNAQAAEMKLIVAINGKNLHATLADNPASRALYAQMPFTVTMKNVYKREVCTGLPFNLPVSKLAGNNYAVGDIIYWPTRRSLAILYRQNGERFRRQHLGHIESGTEIFGKAETIDVSFIPITEP